MSFLMDDNNNIDDNNNNETISDTSSVMRGPSIEECDPNREFSCVQIKYGYFMQNGQIVYINKQRYNDMVNAINEDPYTIPEYSPFIQRIKVNLACHLMDEYWNEHELSFRDKIMTMKKCQSRDVWIKAWLENIDINPAASRKSHIDHDKVDIKNKSTQYKKIIKKNIFKVINKRVESDENIAKLWDKTLSSVPDEFLKDEKLNNINNTDEKSNNINNNNPDENICIGTNDDDDDNNNIVDLKNYNNTKKKRKRQSSFINTKDQYEMLKMIDYSNKLVCDNDRHRPWLVVKEFTDEQGLHLNELFGTISKKYKTTWQYLGKHWVPYQYYNGFIEMVRVIPLDDWNKRHGKASCLRVTPPRFLIGNAVWSDDRHSFAYYTPSRNHLHLFPEAGVDAKVCLVQAKPTEEVDLNDDDESDDDKDNEDENNDEDDGDGYGDVQKTKKKSTIKTTSKQVKKKKKKGKDQVVMDDIKLCFDSVVAAAKTQSSSSSPASSASFCTKQKKRRVV